MISASKEAASGSDLDLDNIDSDGCMELSAFLQECASAKEEPEAADPQKDDKIESTKKRKIDDLENDDNENKQQRQVVKKRRRICPD